MVPIPFAALVVLMPEDISFSPGIVTYTEKLNFRMWFKYGLKAQKLLAQGIALGIMAISKAPCKVGCSKSV